MPRIRTVSLILALLANFQSSALAEEWYPSRYGAQDTLGAINNLSAANGCR